MNIQFVCDSENGVLKNWIKARGEIKKEMDLALDDLRKRAEEINGKIEGLWDSLWAQLQAEGLIASDKTSKDYSMSFNEDTGQLFIRERSSKGAGPQEILSLLSALKNAGADIRVM